MRSPSWYLASGSSPLARGLRGWDGGGEALNRIIPARAGFTISRRKIGAAGGDHPRSRGVYPRGMYADVVT